MLRTRLGLGALALAMGGLMAAAACVGDEPITTGGVKADPNVPAGELRGRCNDGRCLAGLYCDTANDVCLMGDAGGSSSSGGSSSGGSSSGGTGVDAGSCPRNAIAQPVTVCPGVLEDGGGIDGGCGTGQACCLGDAENTCVGDSNMCANVLLGKPLFCTGKATCNGGDFCCLAPNSPSPPSLLAACPGALQRSQMVKTACGPNCSTEQFFVCQNDAECPAERPKCRAVTLQTSKGDLAIGVCF